MQTEQGLVVSTVVGEKQGADLESGQTLLEYILVVVMTTVAIIAVVGTLTKVIFDYYQMQAIWTSLPII